MIGTILSIFGIIFAFGLVIFIHELGHFLVAKKTGVRVEKFSFGFGREILGFQWGETRYTVNWLPLGGYVKMAGEMPDEYEGPVMEGRDPGHPESLERDRSREFMSFPWYRRIPIVVAGPAMNYVLSILIFFFMLLVWGQQVPIPSTEIGQVFEGKPAYQAGLQTGDKILEVEGQPVQSFEELALAIRARPGQKTKIVIDRGNRTLSLNVTPEQSGKIGLIGIAPAEMQFEHRDVGPVSAIGKAINQCWYISKYTLVHIFQKIGSRERPDVAGPVGIVQVISRAVKKGWEEYWGLIALISVAIGLFNLFPIPLLDGGHLLYYIIEGIRGKPLSTKTMGRANMVGLALLLSLLVFATSNDIKRKWPSESGSEQVEQPQTPVAEEPLPVVGE